MPPIADLIDILVPVEPKTYPLGDRAVPSVTSVIEMAGFGPDFSRVAKEVMDFAKDRGRIVHKACEYVDKGTLEYASLDPFIRGYVDAYILFREQCRVQPIAIEEQRISSLWEIGGTPDLICFLNGKRAVVDRKTGDPASVGARLQTAGYATLYWETEKTLIECRYGLKLNRNGTYKLVPHNDAHDESCFIDILDYVQAKSRRDDWMRKYYLQGDKNNGNDAINQTA